MSKPKGAARWIELGYTLFANEGLEGLQIERLARVLELNKSGFYHHFGDLDGFIPELMIHHVQKVDLFLEDALKAISIDPDYLHVLINHSSAVMFQVQLTRIKDNPPFYRLSEDVDRRVDSAVRQLWTKFVGIDSNPDLAMRYYNLVRDMFYARISFDNLNYRFLHELVTEARELMNELGAEVAERSMTLSK